MGRTSSLSENSSALCRLNTAPEGNKTVKQICEDDYLFAQNFFFSITFWGSTYESWWWQNRDITTGIFSGLLRLPMDDARHFSRFIKMQLGMENICSPGCISCTRRLRRIKKIYKGTFRKCTLPQWRARPALHRVVGPASCTQASVASETWLHSSQASPKKLCHPQSPPRGMCCPWSPCRRESHGPRWARWMRQRISSREKMDLCGGNKIKTPRIKALLAPSYPALRSHENHSSSARFSQAVKSVWPALDFWGGVDKLRAVHILQPALVAAVPLAPSEFLVPKHGTKRGSSRPRRGTCVLPMGSSLVGPFFYWGKAHMLVLSRSEESHWELCVRRLSFCSTKQLECA